MNARIGTPLIAILVVLLTVPGAAAARPGWEERPRSLHLSFQTKTSKGFVMSLETAGHRQVNLTFSKGNTSVSYRTTGQVSRTGVEADFGELGEIAVDFRGRRTRFPNPRRELGLPPGLFPPPECRGRRPRHEAGTFHGTIRFEGENGFTQVDTDRVKGTVQRTYRRLCKGGPPRGILGASLSRASASVAEPKRAGIQMNVLAAAGMQGDRKVVFATFGFSGHSGDRELDELLAILTPLAVARTTERRNGVLIKREGVILGEGSLLVSPLKREPITATAVFPKPFEGTGEYQRAAGSSPSWLGSLVARLPGAGAVPLTGGGLTAVLCQISLDEEEAAKNPCLKSAEELLGTGDAPGLLAD